MVRDGSSGRDDELGHEPDADAYQPDHHADHHRYTQDVPSQLTQELARLLAASIAQSQGGKGFPNGVPTGSELASLASLVSAASNQRTLAPVFKDSGLSTLSYSPAYARPAPSLGPATPEPEHDDEPMPIPSTWRQPGNYDEDRWFRQQLGATMLGLAAGLLIVVPAVLWLAGWIGPQRGKPGTSVATANASMDVRVPERKPEPKTPPARTIESAAAAQYVTGSVEPRGNVELRKSEPVSPPIPVAIPVPAAAPQPVAAPPAPKVEEPRARIEDLITQAMRRAEGGDVTGAREILVTVEGGAPGGPVTFALAETYDPNKLAAWGTRGVAADAVRARALYTKALNLGITRAQERLDALQ